MAKSSISGIGGGQKDVQADSSPTLGGNLALGSYTINGAGNINITGAITASGAGTFGSLSTSGTAATGALTVTGNITVSGTVDGRDVATDGTKLDGIEASADVTDEANVTDALDGATLTDVGTPASTDRILLQDASDSNILKYADFSEFAGFTAATQAEQETGTSTTVGVTPGRQHYHTSAAKAWALIDSDATTPVVTADYNIDSMSDSGSGVYTINITNDFSSANYCIVAQTEHSSQHVGVTVRSRSVGSFDITETESASEPEYLHIVAFGDL